jgi:hypothetical protein
MGQRLGEGKRLSLVLHFISRRPVRHSRVERIQNPVTALGLVELRCELERRVVDDRRLASIGDLLEQLSNQRRLARPRVAIRRKWLLSSWRATRRTSRPDRPSNNDGTETVSRIAKPTPSPRLSRLNCALGSAVPSRAAFAPDAFSWPRGGGARSPGDRPSAKKKCAG